MILIAAIFRVWLLKKNKICKIFSLKKIGKGLFVNYVMTLWNFTHRKKLSLKKSLTWGRDDQKCLFYSDVIYEPVLTRGDKPLRNWSKIQAIKEKILFFNIISAKFLPHFGYLQSK